MMKNINLFQEPILFSGSLRSNLDPLRMFSDIEIWTTLELCHLKHFFSKVKEGLDFQVGEGGSNLRQVILPVVECVVLTAFIL